MLKNLFIVTFSFQLFSSLLLILSFFIAKLFDIEVSWLIILQIMGFIVGTLLIVQTFAAVWLVYEKINFCEKQPSFKTYSSCDYTIRDWV